MQLDWKRLFLSADGRIGRQEYWIGVAILFVGGFILGMIPILGLLSIVLIYPQVCVGSKRLHDMGRSGWLMLIPWGVGIVAMVLSLMVGGAALIGARAGGDSGAAAAAMGAGLGFLGIVLLACLVNLAFIIWVGVTPGQPGENRYGPEPVAEPLSAPPPV
jgi:uncharacterized membrane protein YhaH (DUF805 family)